MSLVLHWRKKSSVAQSVEMTQGRSSDGEPKAHRGSSPSPALSHLSWVPVSRLGKFFSPFYSLEQYSFG
jgi:hypothetical protein